MDAIIPMQCLLCFCVILIFSIPATSQSHNISLGSSLTATKENSTYWLSSSGDFAFGFQEVRSNGFLLAIWFNKVPDRTIVWTANRNTLVQSGSTAQLSSSTGLVLRDQSGNQIWSASAVGAVVSYAAMLDTGNFVLASSDADNLWQSFDHPTDTILPTQVLNQDGTLIARYTKTNYSNGRFKFKLQKDGNLVMYTIDYPFTNGTYPYWDTQTSIGSGYQVIFNQSGYIFLASQNGSILNYVSSNPASTDRFYQRAILDDDGVFRQYVYPKTGYSNGTWPMAWSTLSFIPSNICTSINGATGSGACGFNSYCSMNVSTPSCLCPPKYDFLDPQDERLGCKPSFILQTCASTPQDSPELFEIIEMPNTNWPGSDYAMFSSQTEDWCRQACLDDCYCAAAEFGGGECWMKRMPLSNGRTNLSEGGRALLKVRKLNSLPENTKRKDQSTLILVGSILLGSSGLVNILCLIAKNRRRKGQLKVETHNLVPAANLRFFTYKELEAATGGFKEEVGSGGYGVVYKGVLPDEDVAVAVKKLFGDFRPRWYSRVQIAFGIARGLLYLHEECSTTIIHCDIKPQNILLDEYLAPEWFQNFPITVKVDVYSFGIVLLELITCRKSVELEMESESRMILSDWACDCYRYGSLQQLVQEDEEATDDMERVEKFVKIAIWCIQQDPSLRPSMKKVSQMLEGTIPVPAPPGPNSFMSITISCGRGADELV